MNKVNRIIKFRTWDNRWENWVGTFEAKFLNNPEYTVQEFTGMYDRAGKEIFEGDIIEDSLNNETGHVELFSGIFCIRVGDGIGGFWPENVLVIGNICDNPIIVK